MDKTVRISLWSGPRNISTALMYSFAQRSDTQVFDEPLYGHYLTHSDARQYHPGAEKVIATLENDGEKVVREVLLGPSARPVLFFKHMAHHLVELSWDFLPRLKNVILTRHPHDVILSYAEQVRQPILRDTGYEAQVRLLEYLQNSGQEPPVLDSREVLRNPEVVLERLCQRLGIGFQKEMLQWEPGPRPEDGVWAEYWYAKLHQSTGFQPFREKRRPFPEHLLSLLEECLPLYERLYRMAIKADS